MASRGGRARRCIAEVDFADQIDLDADVVAIESVISSYYSSADRPTIPWKLGIADTTLRLLRSDVFPPAVNAHAAHELTAALHGGSLRSRIAARVPLAEIAYATNLLSGASTGVRSS